MIIIFTELGRLTIKHLSHICHYGDTSNCSDLQNTYTCLVPKDKFSQQQKTVQDLS